MTDESISVRPEAMELQRRLIDVAAGSRCTLDEIILAGCTLVANAIAQAHTDDAQTKARVRNVAQSVKAVVQMALADVSPSTGSRH
jgi:hypothetical protein